MPTHEKHRMIMNQRAPTSPKREKELQTLALKVAANAPLMDIFHAALASDDQDVRGAAADAVSSYAQTLDPAASYDEVHSIVPRLLKILGYLRPKNPDPSLKAGTWRSREELQSLFDKISEDPDLVAELNSAIGSNDKNKARHAINAITRRLQEIDPTAGVLDGARAATMLAERILAKRPKGGGNG